MTQPLVKPPVLVPVGAWQDSQAMLPTGTWMLVDSVTKGVPPLFVKLKPAAWQLAQPEVMPEWFIVQFLKPPTPVLVGEWHVSQAAVVGIWVAGFAMTPASEPL
jgi:hypothetical protein